MEGKGNGRMGRLRGDKAERTETERSRDGADAKWVRNGADARSVSTEQLGRIRSGRIQSGEGRHRVILLLVNGEEVKRGDTSRSGGAKRRHGSNCPLTKIGVCLCVQQVDFIGRERMAKV